MHIRRLAKSTSKFHHNILYELYGYLAHSTLELPGQHLRNSNIDVCDAWHPNESSILETTAYGDNLNARGALDNSERCGHDPPQDAAHHDKNASSALSPPPSPHAHATQQTTSARDRPSVSWRAMRAEDRRAEPPKDCYQTSTSHFQ